MIFIPAKIKCDRSSCEASADIELEFREGAQGIPILSLDYLPEGWDKVREHGYGYGSTELILCPEHSKK